MFNFLKQEIPCEGAPEGKVCVNDVWKDEISTMKIIGFDEEKGEVLLFHRNKEFDRYFSSRWLEYGNTLIERHGRAWPHEEEKLSTSAKFLLDLIDKADDAYKEKENPSLVEGRRYWNKIGEWHLFRETDDGLIIFEPGCAYDKMTDVNHCFDLTRDFWQEEAVGKWYMCDNTPIHITDRTDWPDIVEHESKLCIVRDGVIGKQIQSGSIELFPTRQAAVESIKTGDGK